MDPSLPPVSRRALLLGAASLVASRVVSAQEPKEPAPADAASGAGQRRQAPATSPRTPRAFEVDRFIEDCRIANREQNGQAAVREVLDRAMESPRAVMRALGGPTKGGIQTLYRSAELTILNIVWSPLMQLMPHEHNMWALIGIYTGREDNILWDRKDGHIAAARAASLSEADVLPLPKDVIHSVTNPVETFTGAIHVYGGDFFTVARSEWDSGTLEERAWDLDKAVQLFRESNERFSAWRECRR
jgi:predicted metal-dependent enzyme (double-stranded beta helix superfamily)